jgi:DNA polymerase-3 subunit beta
MKFVFDKDAMLKEIAIAQEIISTKNAISILSNVFLHADNGSLTIKATDIKVNFETRIPVEIQEEGTTTIYCDKFISFLSSLPQGEVQFSQDDINVSIKPLQKKVKLQLKSIASDKFPEFDLPDITYFDVPSKDLKEMIAQTIFAISDDATRYFMNGVYFEKKDNDLVLVATDGRRLAYCSKPLCEGIDDFPAAIVPQKILTIVHKRAPDEGMISIAIVDKMIYFKFGNYQFSSVLIDAQFPNYQRVIPELQNKYFEVNKLEFTEALKRVGLLVEQKARRTYFELNPGSLTISSRDSDMGNVDEEIPCEYDGEQITLVLNYLFLDEPTKVINTDRIRFEFTELMKAVTMRPEPASDYFHVIMPMQGKND